VYDVAVTNVDWGGVGREAAIAAAPAPLGGAVCKLSPAACRALAGSAIGSSEAASRLLNNLLDGDECTGVGDGVLGDALVGGLFGGAIDRVSRGIGNWWQRHNANAQKMGITPNPVSPNGGNNLGWGAGSSH
jgi:hypothetical protein